MYLSRNFVLFGLHHILYRKTFHVDVTQATKTMLFLDDRHFLQIDSQFTIGFTQRRLEFLFLRKKIATSHFIIFFLFVRIKPLPSIRLNNNLH